MSENLKTQTLKGVKWSMINSIGGKVIGFLLGVLLARLLSPSDFGLVGMAAIFFAISNIIIDGGFASALVKKQNMTNEDASTVFYFNIVVCIIMCSLICVFSENIAAFLNAPVLKDMVKVSALSMLFGSFGSVQFALLTKQVDFKTQALITLFSQITSGFVGVYLAYEGYGAWAIVWQSFCASAARTVTVWMWSKWRPTLCFSIKSFKELFSFGANLTINSVLDTFFREGIGMIIGKYYSVEQLGLFTRGQHTAQLPSTFLYAMASQVTFPILAKIQDEDERLFAIYRKFMRMFSIIIIFSMILLISIAKPLTIFLFTDKWLDSVIFLQLYCAIYTFNHIHALNYNFLLVKGRTDWILKKEIINKSFKILVVIALLPYGVLNICVAYLISTLFDLCVNTTISGRLFGYGFKQQLADVMPYLLLAIGCCVPPLMLSSVIENPLISLSLGIPSSIILYIVCLTLKKDIYFYELLCISPLRSVATKYIKI